MHIHYLYIDMIKTVHEEEAEFDMKRKRGKIIRCSKCGHLCHCRPVGKYADENTKTSVVCGYIHERFDIPSCSCDDCTHIEENKLIKQWGLI